MISFLNAPTLPNIDFYETTRLRLTWNIHLLLIVGLIPLILISIYAQPFYSVYYGVALAFVLVSLLLIKRTGNYRIFSVTVASILYAMILVSMFKIDSYIHIIEPFWLLVLVMYIYFIHGKTAGGIAILGTVLFTIIFLLFFLKASVANIPEMEYIDSLSMGFEFSVCLSLVGYILHQFIFLKNHAELELKLMNAALRKEKDIVESRDKEKTILLQEIHHRVKNNLQIVMSLLRMQSTKIASEEAKVHFNDAINRILTMSLIHQKLYESDNLSAIDLSEYIESLASDVLRSSQVPHRIEKTFVIDVPEIGMKTIVPVALIITELISNSVKHAFDTTEKPKISLSVRIQEDSNLIEMTYSDNGQWKSSKHDTFGTQLIDALTEQLEGSYTLNTTENGSSYTFSLEQLD